MTEIDYWQSIIYGFVDSATKYSEEEDFFYNWYIDLVENCRVVVYPQFVNGVFI